MGRYLREDRLWVLEADGALASCSAFNAVTDDAVQVGGVYTVPEARGRGFARAVVAASLLEARAAGASRAVPFTPEHNVAAGRAYRAIGFRQVGRYRVLLLRTALTVAT